MNVPRISWENSDQFWNSKSFGCAPPATSTQKIKNLMLRKSTIDVQKLNDSWRNDDVKSWLFSNLTKEYLWTINWKLLLIALILTNGANYSRMDQVKFVEDSL